MDKKKETHWQRMKRRAYEEGKADGYRDAFGKWMRGEVGFLEQKTYEITEAMMNQFAQDLMR